MGRSCGGRTERESKEGDILTKGVIMELVRKLALGKSPGIHDDDSAKNLSNKGKMCLNCPSPEIGMMSICEGP